MWHLWLNTGSDWNKHSSSRRWVRGKWHLGRLFSRIRLASAQCDTFLLTAILNGHLVRVCSSHVHVLSSFSIYLQYFGGRGSTGQCRYYLGSKPNHIALEHHCISKAAKRTGWRSGFQDTGCCCQPVMQSLLFSFWELVSILLQWVGTERGMAQVSCNSALWEVCILCFALQNQGVSCSWQTWKLSPHFDVRVLSSPEVTAGKRCQMLLILVMWLSSNMFWASEQEIRSFKAALVSWFPPSLLVSPFLF